TGGARLLPQSSRGSRAADPLPTRRSSDLDTPDVILMDEKYIAEYGGRGALLNLADAGLDTSEFVEGSVEVGELPEEGLVAINARSEEHTSELQSRFDLVCRLLPEKKAKGF